MNKKDIFNNIKSESGYNYLITTKDEIEFESLMDYIKDIKRDIDIINKLQTPLKFERTRGIIIHDASSIVIASEFSLIGDSVNGKYTLGNSYQLHKWSDLCFDDIEEIEKNLDKLEEKLKWKI